MYGKVIVSTIVGRLKYVDAVIQLLSHVLAFLNCLIWRKFALSGHFEKALTKYGNESPG